MNTTTNATAPAIVLNLAALRCSPAAHECIDAAYRYLVDRRLAVPSMQQLVAYMAARLEDEVIQGGCQLVVRAAALRALLVCAPAQDALAVVELIPGMATESALTEVRIECVGMGPREDMNNAKRTLESTIIAALTSPLTNRQLQTKVQKITGGKVNLTMLNNLLKRLRTSGHITSITSDDDVTPRWIVVAGDDRPRPDGAGYDIPAHMIGR